MPYTIAAAGLAPADPRLIKIAESAFLDQCHTIEALKYRASSTGTDLSALLITAEATRSNLYAELRRLENPAEVAIPHRQWDALLNAMAELTMLVPDGEPEDKPAGIPEEKFCLHGDEITPAEITAALQTWDEHHPSELPTDVLATLSTSTWHNLIRQLRQAQNNNSPLTIH